ANVDLLLRGDDAGWATHAQEQPHHRRPPAGPSVGPPPVRAGRAIRGPVDDRLGPATKAARRAFREGYNREASGALPLDATTGVPDWEAVFELYTQELAVLLSDLGGPSRLWPVVRARSLGTVACGERWPVEAVGLDGYECDDNR